MTAAQPAPDIRDGVAWRPWWLRYAEFGGQALVAHRGKSFWYVCTAPLDEMASERSDDHDGIVDSFETEAEALAAFHAAEERLLAGEL